MVIRKICVILFYWLEIQDHLTTENKEKYENVSAKQQNVIEPKISIVHKYTLKLSSTMCMFLYESEM
jgi:hypothetical protein